VANPIVIPISATGTYSTYVDWASGYNISWFCEAASGATGSYTVNITGDDPNDTTWTPVWIADGVADIAQTTSKSNYYAGYPIRGIQVVFTAITGNWRFVVLQALSAR